MKRILETVDSGWYIVKIDAPTVAMNFKGEKIRYAYYYRIYDKFGSPIKFCKFQQLDRLAQALGVAVEVLPVREEE